MQKPPKAKLPNQMADLGGQIVMINFKKLSLKALDRQQTPSPEPPTDKLLQRYGLQSRWTEPITTGFPYHRDADYPPSRCQ
jgi:hypothetical protein